MSERLETYVALEPPKRPELDFLSVPWAVILTPEVTWYIPMCVPNAADYIHASTKDKSGYGGACVRFRDVFGQVLAVRGPWHANAKSLKHETNVDLLNFCYTWGFVCLSINDSYKPWAGISGLLYSDANEFVLGQYERIDTIAQQIANERGENVFRYQMSIGGSHQGYVSPE